MNAPVRTTVTASIELALLKITRISGYRTNIGNEVLIGGDIKAPEAYLPCCILNPGAETPADNADPVGSAVIDYGITAFANRRDEAAQFDRNEWELIDAMLQDIRTVVEGAPCTIDGARSIVYQGATPIYSGQDSEPCGVTARYLITTKQY